MRSGSVGRTIRYLLQGGRRKAGYGDKIRAQGFGAHLPRWRNYAWNMKTLFIISLLTWGVGQRQISFRELSQYYPDSVAEAKRKLNECGGVK